MKQRPWRWNEVESGGICAIIFTGLCPSTGMSPEACDAKGGVTFKCHGDITCKAKSNDPCQQITYEQ